MIKKEIPTGLINWINTLYELSETWTIMSVIVDWVEITSWFTLNWTSLTLTNAPTLNIKVIYNSGTWIALKDWEIIEPNEVLTWDVNWSNTIFYATKPILNVIDLIYDWVDTLDFTYNIWDTKIILWNAPQHWDVHMDYITTSSSTWESVFWDNSTQNDIINRIYTEVLWNEKTTSSIYQIDNIRQHINDVQDLICTWFYKASNNKEYRAFDLTFLNRPLSYTFYNNIKVTVTVNIWDTSITIWDNDLPQTWILYLNWQIITYNWNSNWILSNIIWVKQPIYAWTKWYVAQWLPDDFGKMNFLKKYNNEKPLDYIDNRWLVYGRNQWYSIIEDWYWNKYIIFVNLSDKDIVSWEYVLKTPNITTEVNSIIPKPYALTIIPYLVGYRVFLKDEPVKARNLEIQGVQELERLYSYYSSKTKWYGDQIQSFSYWI